MPTPPPPPPQAYSPAPTLALTGKPKNNPQTKTNCNTKTKTKTKTILGLLVITITIGSAIFSHAIFRRISEFNVKTTDTGTGTGTDTTTGITTGTTTAKTTGITDTGTTGTGATGTDTTGTGATEIKTGTDNANVNVNLNTKDVVGEPGFRFAFSLLADNLFKDLRLYWQVAMCASDSESESEGGESESGSESQGSSTSTTRPSLNLITTIASSTRTRTAPTESKYTGTYIRNLNTHPSHYTTTTTTMSSGSNQPTTPLSSWFRTTFEALYTNVNVNASSESSSTPSSSTPSSSSPPSSSNSQSLLSQTFTAGSEQYLNHEHVSLDDLSKKMWEGSSSGSGNGTGSGTGNGNRLFSGGRVTVDWRELIEVPGSGSAEEGVDGEKEAGIIAGFFVVTRSSHVRIRVGPMQRLNYNTFSAKVVSPRNATPENPQYHISQLFITSLDEAAPIQVEGFAPHARKAKASEGVY